jgi:uncharacterized protein
MAFARTALALLFALSMIGAAAAQTTLIDSVPHITVIGHAHTEVAPDYAVLSLAVVTERPKAIAAAAANAAAAQALIDEVKAQGIDAKDVQTSEVSLNPVYDTIADAEGRGTTQKLRGYQARNGLTIRVRALAKAGALAASLIDKGANELQGLSFGSSHEDELNARLNDAAMRDALRAAQAYLPAAGVSLGRVLEIAPNDEGGYRPRVFAAAAPAFARDAAVPIAPGTLSYDSQVRVTWELVGH